MSTMLAVVYLCFVSSIPFLKKLNDVFSLSDVSSSHE